MWSRRKTKDSIGIDIGTSFIKVVEIETKGKVIRKKFRESELPEGVIVEREILDTLALIDKIKELKAVMEPEGKDVSLGLSTGTIIRRVKTGKTKENISEIAKKKAQEVIPYDLNDVYWDFKVLSETKDEISLVIVGARRELVSTLIDIFKASEITLHKIIPESIAYEYILKNYFPLGKRRLLIDIGDSFTDFHLFSVNNDLVSSRDLSQGVSSYVKSLRKVFGISEEKAKSYLLGKLEEEPEAKITEFVERENELFCTHILRILPYVWETEEDKPDEIILSGFGSQIVGLPEKLENYINLPVTTLDLGENLPPWSYVALGLALSNYDVKGINLLPIIERPVTKPSLLQEYSLPILGTLSAILIASIFYTRTQTQIWNLQVKLDELRTEEAILKRKSHIVADILKEEKVISQKNDILENLIKHRFRYVEFLNDLILLTPEKVWLNSIFEYQGDTTNPTENYVRIQGVAFTPREVGEFIRNLENFGKFKEVRLNYIRKEVVDNAGLQGFEIIVYFK